MKFSKAHYLEELVTFIPNKKEPIHNWYLFKEGFSKQLVDIFLDKFALEKNSVVLEPFCGTGTTLLACKQRGIKSVGFDVSPFFVFVSKVKTRDYDLKELKEHVSMASKWKFEKPEKTFKEKFVKRMFSKYLLEDFVFYQNKINEIKNEKMRDFLLLALVDCTMSSGYAFKDGAVVKIKKRNTPPLKKFFKYKIKKMYKDLEKSNLNPTETRVTEGDARNLKLGDESVDAVITSPPYLHKSEYSNIFKIEETLLGIQRKERPFIGTGDDSFDLYPDFPQSAKSYFNDMDKVLKELYRVCGEKSKIAMVIGGGCFPDKVIECDLVLAELAENIGFKLKNILVARNFWCTRARTIKVGMMRESVIILEK
ncbi:MAG: DNA methyltransferase [Candidatus Aenigmatarchaeota archaeon]